jgi:hypothetical protein
MFEKKEKNNAAKWKFYGRSWGVGCARLRVQERKPDRLVTQERELDLLVAQEREDLRSIAG